MDRMRWFCVLAVGWFVPVGAAQRSHGRPGTAPVAPHAAATGPQGIYAAEPAVTERFDTSYGYQADGTGEKLETLAVRVQSEAAARALTVISVPYSAAMRQVEFVAVEVRKPDGTVIQTPAADAQDSVSPMAQAAPQYSDMHLLRIGVRGLAPGDRLMYTVRTRYTHAEAPNQFWGAESFGRGRLLLERSLTLRVPVGKPVRVICPGHPAEVSEEGGTRVYRWTGAQLRPTRDAVTGVEEELAAEPIPPIAWTTFASWGEVGQWFRSTVGNAAAVTAAVQARADAVTYGLSSAEARRDALYGFVAREIQTINVPLGQGSWTPHPAEEVLRNQFGDSKDKSVLLMALLRAEHLEASLALVPSGTEVDEAAPSPRGFSRVLVVARGGPQGEVWLDPAEEVAAPGAMSLPERGRLALVSPTAGEARLQRTPETLPYAELSRYVAHGAASADGVLTAHVDLQTRGDEEMALRQALRSVERGRWDGVAQSYARLRGLPGEVSDVDVEFADRSDVPLRLRFDLVTAAARAATGPGALLPEIGWPFAGRKSSPGEDIPLGDVRTETAVASVVLGTGAVPVMPSAVHVHTDFAEVDTTFLLEQAGAAKALVAERTMRIKRTRLSAGDWEAYRRFLDELGVGVTPGKPPAAAGK